MTRFHNLLFASLGTNAELEALKQALSLARNHSARLSVLQIAPRLPEHYERYKEQYYQSIEENTQRLLEQACSEINLEDTSLINNPLLVASEHPDRSIIEHVLRGEHDLLIKDAESGKDAEGFRAVDMSLLRQCHCPVWLCKPISAHRQQIKVAAAIDPTDASDKGQELAKSLLQIGRMQADMCDGNLHVVACLNSILESELRHNILLKVPAEQIEKDLVEEKAAHKAMLDDVIASSQIIGRQTLHQIGGAAEEALPEFVRVHNIDILVMGTQARTGLAGFFIGNTAENVLRSLPCSLFTIKPAGFESPLAP